MEVDRDGLHAELRTLCKGRGVVDSRLKDRVGEQLRQLCDIAQSEETGAVREKLTKVINIHAQHLPEDEQLAVKAALAMHRNAQQRFLSERIDWLAGRINRGARVARRRIDEALIMLAERMLPDLGQYARSAEQDDSHAWRIESFQAVLRLDTETPELWDQRRITFQNDGVTEIVGQLSLPRARAHPMPLQIEVLYGGVLTSLERYSPSHWRFVLKLPRAFNVRAVHEYGLLFRIMDKDLLEPHYVFQPSVPCASFELRLRFPLSAVPTMIWRLNGVPYRSLEDRQPTPDILRVDASGDLKLTFSALNQSLTYGVQWTAE